MGKKKAEEFSISAGQIFLWESKTLSSTSAEQDLQGKPTELGACGSTQDTSFISLRMIWLHYNKVNFFFNYSFIIRLTAALCYAT